MKNMVCVVSHAPYASSHSLEAIEAAMVGAVFDFNVSILFRGEGVWCLLNDQDANLLRQRSIAKVATALPTYDIDKVYVCSQAMEDTGLGEADLCVPVTQLSPEEQGRLINDQDIAIGAQS